MLGGRKSGGILRLFFGGDFHGPVELLISSVPASVLKPVSASEDALQGPL